MGKKRFASTSGEPNIHYPNGKPNIHYSNDGLSSHNRGWNVGVVVESYVNAETGEDEFMIWTTGGSHNPARTKWIGRVDSKGVFTPNPYHIAL